MKATGILAKNMRLGHKMMSAWAKIVMVVGCDMHETLITRGGLQKSPWEIRCA